MKGGEKMTRTYGTRVDLSSRWILSGSHQFGAVMDMLRYAGLLHSNIKGFPKIIEYDQDSEAARVQTIARWRSFGITAIPID